MARAPKPGTPEAYRYLAGLRTVQMNKARTIEEIDRHHEAAMRLLGKAAAIEAAAM